MSTLRVSNLSDRLGVYPPKNPNRVWAQGVRTLVYPVAMPMSGRVGTFTELVDTHNAFDPATGVFTVPVEGLYGVTFSISASTVATVVVDYYVRKNGVVVSDGFTQVNQFAASVWHGAVAIAHALCAPGDTLDVFAYTGNAQTNAALRYGLSVVLLG